MIEMHVLTKRQPFHGIGKDSAREVGIGIEYLEQRRPSEGYLQVGVEVVDFLYLFAPIGVFMHFVQEKVLSSHLMETLAQVEQGVIGEIHAVHDAIQCFSGCCPIMGADVLAHQGGLAHASGASYGY